MRKPLAAQQLSLWIGLGFCVYAAEAFEIQTHVAINEAAVVRSSLLETYLSTQLALLGGIRTPLDGSNRVQDWISLGGGREDNNLRFLNHFHDPLKAWSTAGLGGVLTASIIWGQDAELCTAPGSLDSVSATTANVCRPDRGGDFEGYPSMASPEISHPGPNGRAGFRAVHGQATFRAASARACAGGRYPSRAMSHSRL